MGSVSKCSRLSSEDRISKLLDDILGHILSFLPTKEAVATSILSRRWINVWNFITIVDLDDDELPWEYDSPLTKNLPSVVYRVLLMRKPSCLRKFCLCMCKVGYRASDANLWIDYALRCNVKHLDIYVVLKDVYAPMSLKIFSSTTLTVLKLSAQGFVLNTPFTFVLPNLKVIHLCGVIFPDDDSFTRFVCGCPALEEFNLQRFIGSDLRVIKIVSSVLKRLVLNQVFVERYSVDVGCIGYKIIVNAPSLVHLEIDNCCADLCSIVDSPRLTEARIHFYHENWTHVEDIVDFLKGISNVQSLDLCWYGLEPMMIAIISEGNDNFPRFPRLRNLLLHVDYERDLLAKFLQKAPHLETLDYSEKKYSESRQQQYFECQTISNNLKFVDIDIEMHDGLKSCEQLKSCADMVTRFLNKTKALEKLTFRIVSSEGVERELEMENYFRNNYEEKALEKNMESSSPSGSIWTLKYFSRSKYFWGFEIMRK